MVGRARQADADVSGRLSAALSEFGLGFDALQERLGGRSWKVLYSGLPHVLKLAADGAVDRLQHEARCLKEIAQRDVVISEHAFVVPFVEGKPLDSGSLVETALRNCLAKVHHAGYTFCDLRPSNIVVNQSGYHLIDWEFCTKTGTRVAELPSRPYSSGYTHPDLIWGRGVIDPRLDHFSLERIIEVLK